MTFKDVIQKNYERQEKILNALCEARDKFDKKEEKIEYDFIQGIIAGFSGMRMQFQTDFEKAQIEELKNKL